jgi:hypothetical protein
VQDHGQQRLIHFYSSVVFDEAEFPEFVHEEIYPRSRSCDHARQGFLRDFWREVQGLVGLSVARQKRQRPCQAFFAGVEELIDQVFLDANVVREHVGDEMVGQFVFGVQYPR